MSQPNNVYNNQKYQGGYAFLGQIPMGPDPSRRNIPSMKVQIVPQDVSLGYDALTHGVQVPNSNGYFPVGPAYPMYEKKKCTTFDYRVCDGVNIVNRLPFK